MRRTVSIVASICMIALATSCMFIAGDPEPGAVRVALTKESPVTEYSNYYGYSMSMTTYAAYLAFSEFPSTITWGDFIDHEPGTFSAKYLIFGWDGNYSYYWSDLADDWMYYQGDVSTQTADYLYQRASTIAYTITADAGHSGTFLTMPEDGEDRDYTIMLTYDPADLSVSYRGLDLPLLSKTIEENCVRKVFDDGHYTISVTVGASANSDTEARTFTLDE